MELPAISTSSSEVYDQTAVSARNLPSESAVFTHLTIDEGLSQSTITSIAQDSYGFIWIGTLDGLNKYDGYRFINYRHDPDQPDSLSGNVINDLLVDHEGKLWIATGDGLNQYDRSTDGFLHFLHDPNDAGSLSSSDVLSLFESSEYELWVGTASGLNHLDKSSTRFDRYQHDPAHPETLINDRVQAISEKPAGYLWLGTPEGLDEFNVAQDSFDHFTFDLIDRFSLSNPDIRDLVIDPEGELWIATYGGGINKWVPEFRHFERFQHEANFPWSLTDNRVHALLVDEADVLWIATEGGLDILRPDEDRFVHIRHDPLNPRSISSNSVRSLLEDRGGVIWAGTTGSGLNLYDSFSKGFRHVRFDPSQRLGLPDNNVLSILEDNQQVLWVGTERGLTGFNPRTGAVIRYEHNPANPSSIAGDQVRTLFQDHAGMLWVGTMNGLDRLDRRIGSFRHFSSIPDNPTSLSSDAINAIGQDAWGNLWVGTASGLNRFDPQAQSFTRIYLDPQTPQAEANQITDLVISPDGYLWLATNGRGLFKTNRSGEIIQHFSHDPENPASLSHSTLTTLYMDEAKRLWVGSIEGLNLYDPSQEGFIRFRSRDGLPNDTINCILSDENGSVWISTNRGLARLDNDLQTIRSYTLHDGIQSNEFLPACTNAQDGTLYFGGVNGYNAFQPEDIQDNPNPPAIVLTALTQGGDLLAEDPAVEDVESITLNWPDTFFEFEFAGLSYPQPVSNEYAYRLLGFDENWSEIGTRRFGRYTNLPPGDYTLELLASNHDGVWAEPVQALAVKVVPPFWQTWAFRIGVGAFIFLSAVIGYRLRVRSIQLRSRELEQQVHSRTQEIEQRRQQIEALYRADDEMYRYLELNAVLSALASVSVDVLEADRSAVWVWDPDLEQLALSASRGLNGAEDWPAALSADEPEVVQAQTSGEPIIVEKMRSTQDGTGVHSTLMQHIGVSGGRACMHLPVWVEQRLFALFSVCYTSRENFTPEDQRLYEALVKRAVVAIENARLYQRTQEIAVLEERNRLARELHDAVTQTLFSASLIAEALPDLWTQDPAEGESLLQELRGLSRGALAEMRALLLELRPTALLESPLADLLQQLAEAASSKQGLPIELSTNGVCELPGEVHLALYRIAQEALNNAVKHAQASKVQITLACTESSPETPACVALTVEDDGLGFDPTQVASDRLGLKILVERAESIGAHIQIHAQIGGGSRIHVRWQEEHDGEK